MNIYTSYYDNIKNIPNDYILISISGGITDEIKSKIHIWDKKLAPSLDIYNEYKNSNKEYQYVSRYKTEILNKRNLLEIIKNYKDEYKNSNNFVLLCYETPTEFCHRHIVAEELETLLHIKIKELNVNSNRVNFKYE